MSLPSSLGLKPLLFYFASPANSAFATQENPLPYIWIFFKVILSLWLHFILTGLFQVGEARVSGRGGTCFTPLHFQGEGVDVEECSHLPIALLVSRLALRTQCPEAQLCQRTASLTFRLL